jgi:hypothetical protein
MKNKLFSILAAVLLSPVAANASLITVTSNSFSAGAQNLVVQSVGATISSTVTSGSYVAGGQRGVLNEWERPVIPFLNSDFSGLAGGTLISAVLRFSTTYDFLEAGESITSLVRLFSTGETSLTSTNRNVFAGLSGDGGAGITIGSYTHSNDVFGAFSISITGASLTSLESLINSGDATLAASFIEAPSNDRLDEYILGRSLQLEVTADVPDSVPTPATLALFGLGLAGLGWSRRKRT